MTINAIRIVPANEASDSDLEAVFGGGEGRGCQYFKLDQAEWTSTVSVDERAERLRAQSNCGHPQARTTSGLVAYWESEPAGWCAVEPRTAYSRLLRMRVPWSGRDEDKTDENIWAVTCFVVRGGYRRRGIATALAAAAAQFARDHGARAIEGYARVVQEGDRFVPAYLYVGTLGLFAAAGFHEVSRPTAKRAVMRIDF